MDELPRPKRKLQEGFRAMPLEEFLMRGSHIVLTPLPATPIEDLKLPWEKCHTGMATTRSASNPVHPTTMVQFCTALTDQRCRAAVRTRIFFQRLAL
jgi:hypothetical protein